MPGYYDNNQVYHEFRSTLRLSLHDFREAVSGDVINAAGNGGIMTSDTTPALTGTAATAGQQLSWATGNVDQILCQAALPGDFDGRDDCFLELWVSSGTTNAASLVVLSNWDGAAADISDTADDAATKSATIHKITAQIAATDIPDNASFVSFALTPPTHATDTIQLFAARLRYTARVKSL